MEGKGSGPWPPAPHAVSWPRSPESSLVASPPFTDCRREGTCLVQGQSGLGSEEVSPHRLRELENRLPLQASTARGCGEGRPTSFCLELGEWPYLSCVPLFAWPHRPPWKLPAEVGLATGLREPPSFRGQRSHTSPPHTLSPARSRPHRSCHTSATSEPGGQA